MISGIGTTAPRPVAPRNALIAATLVALAILSVGPLEAAGPGAPSAPRKVTFKSLPAKPAGTPKHAHQLGNQELVKRRNALSHKVPKLSPHRLTSQNKKAAEEQAAERKRVRRKVLGQGVDMTWLLGPGPVTASERANPLLQGANRVRDANIRQDRRDKSWFRQHFFWRGSAAGGQGFYKEPEGQ